MLLKLPPKKTANAPDKAVSDMEIDSYEVKCDFVVAKITIQKVRKENVPIYDVKMPVVSEATELVLKEIIEKLARVTKVTAEEINDPHKNLMLRSKFFESALEEVHGYFPNINDFSQMALAGLIVQRMYGFGKLDIIMADNNLEDVCINRADRPVCVYHKQYGWVKTNVFIDNEEQTYNFASMIGRKVGRDINSLNPIMDAHLVTGDRVAATIFPISSAGNTMSFRRFARSPWTVTHLIEPRKGVMTMEMAAVLWLALEFELNILVCGGTASGKTSVLNALCALMPKNQRILSIEDTREFSLPVDLNWNWVPMCSRAENSEGFGKVSMLDLIVAALRMRPDRIIVGEVRTREQAETMFEAMHTGHSVYTTMHADTVEQMARRLVEPPISIPKNEVEALHIILVQHRDRMRNVRRTLELAEVLRTSGLESDLKVNYLYRWRPRTDTFENVEESIRLIEDITLRTGMTLQEIKKNIEQKKMILQWLLDNKVYDTNMIGKLMKAYYMEKGRLLMDVRKNASVEDVLAQL
ncbi:Flp pilus assembly complex ATPase component TadA [Candidatus Woesearchaeota archaeon]|nr:Flp pilus assembly complex ATPase component TadA [Candidatus Woesearchaeota archaeon]